MKLTEPNQSIHQRSDHLITFLALALAIIGVIMSASAGMETASAGLNFLTSYVLIQVLYLVLAFIMMRILTRLFSFRRFQKYLGVWIVLMFVLLLATRFYPMVNGAYAWLRFKIAGRVMTLQPSEFAKLLVILLFAYYLGDLRLAKRPYPVYLRPLLVIISLFAGIIILWQKDFGSGIVLISLSLIELLVPSHRPLRKIQISLVVLGVIVLSLGIFLISQYGFEFLKIFGFKNYQIARFQSALNPFLDRSGDGYQVVNSLIAMVKGGLLGAGLGNSSQKYGYVPEVRTDSIFPIIAEEVGLIGVLVIFFLYFALIARLFYFAIKVYDEKAKLVFIGLASYLFIHFFFNIGGITGLIPLTGVPLLLISSGGSSTLSLFMGLGIAQALIRQYGLK